MAAGLRQEFDRGGSASLILLGHGGRRLWEAVEASGIASEHRIDDYSVGVVDAWLARHLPGHRHRLVYPGTTRWPAVPGQAGRLAPSFALHGWHQRPMGHLVRLPGAPWLIPTPAAHGAGGRGIPLRRLHRPALRRRLPGGGPSARPDSTWPPASPYRRQPASRRRTTRQARLACPVGTEHRYCEAQIERPMPLPADDC